MKTPNGKTANGKHRRSKANFFQDSALHELADIQKVKPLRDPSSLAGAIPLEIDIDAFLEEIYEAKDRRTP